MAMLNNQISCFYHDASFHHIPYNMIVVLGEISIFAVTLEKVNVYAAMEIHGC